MTEESVSFPGSTGAQLVGRVRRPAGQVTGWALLAHCFTCGKDLRAARLLSEALAARGLGVLRFDFTGLGESEGDFEQTSFLSNVDDLVAAARWLEETEMGPSILVGHSLGGTAALAAAVRLDTVRAVATVGAPFAPGHASWIFDPVRERLEAEGEADLQLGGRTLRVGRELLRTLETTSIARDLQQLERALLVLHAPQDEVVGVDNARSLYEAARHPKSFVSLDGADHMLSRPDDARYAGGVIAAWASRYIDRPPQRPNTPLPSGTVRTTTQGGFRTEVQACRHQWIADEPKAVGGADEGPTPYDMLLAGLGACTSMTLRMYADRKQLPLRSVSVTLTHHRDYSSDCVGCEETPKRIDIIERTIHLDGDLTEAQRARMLQIADKCPVHRTLHGPISVVSRLAEP